MSSRHEVSRRRRSRSRSVKRHRSPERRRSKSRSAERRRSRSRSVERGRPRRARSPSPDRRRERSAPRATSSKDTNKKSKEKEKSTSKHKKSKKKKKKRSSSTSSSSSGSSSSSVASEEEELKLLQRLQAERERLVEEKKKEKEAMKANETPEEKRARRLREKQAKERRRRERMGWDTEYQCYTDQDNPFGDSALTHSFVWSKKLARDGVRQVSRVELDASARQKQMENKIELEKVKQRRLEREAERSAREAEAGAAARAREAAQFSTWARQEDAFHLQQARLRSQIRIRDGRAKPIDLLAWYVSSEECVEALEMHEPYTILNGLQASDLEDLLEDIAVYRELEPERHAGYWTDVHTIACAELLALRRLAAPAAARDTVHQAVADDVTQIFKGKTGAQLEALQTQIELKISGRRDGVDVGYWESLLSQLKAHMARARLRDRHQHNLRRKLQLLKREQGVAAPSRSRSRSVSPARPPLADDSPPGGTDGGTGGTEQSEEACEELYVSGRYSPALLSPSTLEPTVLLLTPADDAARLAFLRARLRPRQDAPQSSSSAGAGAGGGGAGGAGGAEGLEAAARRAMGAASADEAQFSVEVALPQDAPALWPDKYRPRKPRYFNRVHTGFEWNKYNQTHYDMDNPPPKIVQGYKFNIFYPDLIDKQATPSFTLKVCEDNGEFAVLRFHAGPPYEDIAFKIVNREWEYSYKRGFRCHFHNNIFQLWFHFKRYRYRR